MKYLLNICLIFVFLFSNISIAHTIINEEDIDVIHDVIIINSDINTASVDATVLKIHNLQLFNKDRPIYLLLNSPGGEVIEGTRIIDSMTASKRPIYTVVMGSAASMAAFIHSYGVKRYMMNNSELMYHLISGGYTGDIIRIQSRLQHILSISDILNSNICSRSNVTLAELNDKEMKEWWITSTEALSRHLIDDTISSTAFFIPKEEIVKEPIKDIIFPFFFPKK